MLARNCAAKRRLPPNPAAASAQRDQGHDCMLFSNRKHQARAQVFLGLPQISRLKARTTCASAVLLMGSSLRKVCFLSSQPSRLGFGCCCSSFGACGCLMSQLAPLKNQYHGVDPVTAFLGAEPAGLIAGAAKASHLHAPGPVAAPRKESSFGSSVALGSYCPNRIVCVQATSGNQGPQIDSARS